MSKKEKINDTIKESRKRNLRILDAALKEQVVDIQVVLGICVQISRQELFNELWENYLCLLRKYLNYVIWNKQTKMLQGLY